MVSERMKLLLALANSATTDTAPLISELLADPRVRQAKAFAGGRIAAVTEVATNEGRTVSRLDPVATNAYIEQLLNKGAPRSNINGMPTLSLEDAVKR